MSTVITKHSTLVIMAIACFMFWTTYWFWRFCHALFLRHSLLTGISLGFTLLTQVSGVLLFPIFLIAGGGLWLASRRVGCLIILYDINITENR